MGLSVAVKAQGEMREMVKKKKTKNLSEKQNGKAAITG